jgi:hypothetical protein
MTIQHIVLFKFLSTTTQSHIESLQTSFDYLPTLIPTIKNLYFKQTFTTDRNQGFSHMLFVEFESKKDLELYAKHQAHVDIVVRMVRGFVENDGVLAIDVEI